MDSYEVHNNALKTKELPRIILRVNADLHSAHCMVQRGSTTKRWLVEHSTAVQEPVLWTSVVTSG